MKKNKATSKEVGESLWRLCKKFSEDFFNSFLKDIIKFDIELNENLKPYLKRQITIINLWIISKVFSSDEKVLDVLHKIYLFGYANLGKTSEEKEELFMEAQKELRERYKEYYEIWDKESEENEVPITLASAMLQRMLNEEGSEPKEPGLAISVMAYGVSILGGVLEFRKGLVIID